ncbi:MAG: hypothetical protein H6557_32090 [Lewinellaceae bacterium]|nr:hypothetical protein [Phaeodactylibacter sp.]MCB9041286.1 hypothetical protein [Lewinellaceae bacterium]
MRSSVFKLLALFVVWAPALLGAQTTDLHVITKRLEKTFAYQPGYEVNIEGEKAEVVVETWDKPQIAVRLELVARHPDKATAEADLEKIRYLAERVKNKIYLRNYIALKEGEAKPKSNLQAHYVVTVPEDCPVYLKNYFGMATVSNLTRSFRFFGEFSKIDLENVQGTIDLQSRFGDIFGKFLDGNVSIASRRSDITLEEIKGSFDIQSQYGVISILSVAGLLDLNIEAEKGDVYLFDPKLREYAYTLAARHGQVNYPSDLGLELLSDQQDLKKMQFKPNQEYYPSITISVTFGDVYLAKEKPGEAKRP